MKKEEKDFLKKGRESNNLDFYLFLELDDDREKRSALLRFLLPHPGKSQGRVFPESILKNLSRSQERLFRSDIEKTGFSLGKIDGGDLVIRS